MVLEDLQELEDEAEVEEEVEDVVVEDVAEATDMSHEEVPVNSEEDEDEEEVDSKIKEMKLAEDVGATDNVIDGQNKVVVLTEVSADLLTTGLVVVAVVVEKLHQFVSDFKKDIVVLLKDVSTVTFYPTHNLNASLHHNLNIPLLRIHQLKTKFKKWGYYY